MNTIFFLYNGNKLNINEDLKVKDINKGKNLNEINIVISDLNTEIKNEKKIILSIEIICPICKENIIIINFDNYRIFLLQCKNNDKIYNIFIKDFKNTQKIDISKIKCENCQNKNKSNTFNNEFYRCLKCKLNVCPLCKSNHEKKHNIINYEDKDFKCDIHFDNYVNYCKNCNINICIQCTNEHENHEIIFYGKMKKIAIKEIKEEIKELKN